MRKSTFTKTALSLVAMTLCMSSVMADPTPIKDDILYQLTLPEFLQIEATTTPAAQNATYGENYGSVSMDSAMVGMFTVISNKSSKTIYLQGTAPLAAGSEPALGKDGTGLVLVFANNKASAASVASARGGEDATVTSNANAIAFRVVPAYTHNMTGGKAKLDAAEYDSTKKQIPYNMQNGTATFTYTVGPTSIAQTFNELDEDGIYQAQLTLTDTSL